MTPQETKNISNTLVDVFVSLAECSPALAQQFVFQTMKVHVARELSYY